MLDGKVDASVELIRGLGERHDQGDDGEGDRGHDASPVWDRGRPKPSGSHEHSHRGIHTGSDGGEEAKNQQTHEEEGQAIPRVRRRMHVLWS